MFADEIIFEIDSTLEQLIKNAETLKCANLTDLSENEIDAFQKTQESLLHHLMHMDQILETKRKGLGIKNKRSATFRIQEKAMRFEKLKNEVNDTIRLAEKKNPFFTKRRGKRLLK